MLELFFEKKSKLKSEIFGEIQTQTKKSWESFVSVNPSVPRSEIELEERINNFLQGGAVTKMDLLKIHDAFQNPNLGFEVMNNLIVLLNQLVPHLGETLKTDHFNLKYTTESKNKLDNITNIHRVRELGSVLDEHYEKYEKAYGVAPYWVKKRKPIDVELYHLEGSWGFTTPSGPIVLDSVGIQKPNIFYKTVSAHELFHRIQYAFGFQVSWHMNYARQKFFSEGTASWAEVWRNDGTIGLSYKIFDGFKHADKGLFHEAYESVTFWMMFHKRYGGDQLKHYLEKCKDLKDPIKALDEVCKEKTNNDDHKGLKGACLLYYSLLNSRYYPDAWKAGYPIISDSGGKEIEPKNIVQKVINEYKGRALPYSAQYFEIALPGFIGNNKNKAYRGLIKTPSFKNAKGYYSTITAFESNSYEGSRISPKNAIEQENPDFSLSRSKDYFESGFDHKIIGHISTIKIEQGKINVPKSTNKIIGIVGAPDRLLVYDEEFDFEIKYLSNLAQPESTGRLAICLKNDQLFMASGLQYSNNINIGNSYDGKNWAGLVDIRNQTTYRSPSLCEFKGDLYMAYVGVSPTNGLYISKSDNGLKWDTIRNLKHLKTIGSPSLCEFKGDLYMAYVGEWPKHGLYVSKSGDGLKWDTNRHLKHQKSIHDASLCEFKEDLYMAYVGEWPKNRIYISKSNDGLNWDTTHKLEHHKSVSTPSLCKHQIKGENGIEEKLYMAYVGEWPERQIYVSESSDGVNWDTTTLLKEHIASGAPVLYSVGGVLFIAYNGDIYYRVYCFELALKEKGLIPPKYRKV